jgi:hypothetical protein
MSDIQDLIHKTSMDCIERGKIVERDRIIKLLETDMKVYLSPQYSTSGGFLEQFVLRQAIALIKGETNAAV